mmetsp:Transcript_21316/g.46974  ORF Transcript_21316/g.46974 Transcript_21316/m.46974 type:complete len:317 (-) Transcript_21316:3-953(-)
MDELHVHPCLHLFEEVVEFLSPDLFSDQVLVESLHLARHWAPRAIAYIWGCLASLKQSFCHCLGFWLYERHHPGMKNWRGRSTVLFLQQPRLSSLSDALPNGHDGVAGPKTTDVLFFSRGILLLLPLLPLLTLLTLLALWLLGLNCLRLPALFAFALAIILSFAFSFGSTTFCFSLLLFQVSLLSLLFFLSPPFLLLPARFFLLSPPLLFLRLAPPQLLLALLALCRQAHLLDVQERFEEGEQLIALSTFSLGLLVHRQNLAIGLGQTDTLIPGGLIDGREARRTFPKNLEETIQGFSHTGLGCYLRDWLRVPPSP